MNGCFDCFQANPGDKKTQIIAAAARVFAEKGFHPAKVEEIAAAAGVGKGTVYEYFSSKAQLYREMMRFYIENYLRFIREGLDVEQTAREQVTAIMRLHLQFLLKNKGMSELSMDSHPPIDAEMREWIYVKKGEILRGLAGLLEKGIERGEIRPFNTAVAAQVIFGAMMSLSGEIFLARKDVDVEEIIKETVEIIFQGLQV